MDQLYVVIMAGGVGSRFWPMSRGGTPKQFLRLLGPESLLEQTVARIEPLVPPERILVVTAAAQAERVRELLPTLPPANVLPEPEGRNTAPCIALAAVAALARHPAAVLAVLPADHFVGDGDSYRENVRTALRLAQEGHLVTIGLTPTRPETGYGYLQLGPPLEGAGVRRVERFVEKPGPEAALDYVASGQYLWNSGMFCFTARRYLAELARHLPEHGAAFQQIAAAWATPEVPAIVAREYRQLRSISVDHGIMEHAEDIAVVVATFPWSDVGTWAALQEVLPREPHGSVTRGRVVELEGRDNVLVAEQGVVATLGLEEMIVVRSGDAVLVCPRERSQEVRRIVDALRQQGIEVDP